MFMNLLKFRSELPTPVPAAAGVGLGPIARETIRPIPAELPQHLTLPTEPFVILAHHPALDVLVCRHVGFTCVALYVSGFDVTDEAGITVAEATWLCNGPADLVRRTIKEKFNVELA